MLITRERFRSTYPRRSLSESIYYTADVVIQYSSRSNLINAAMSGASVLCTRAGQQCLLLPWSNKYGGAVDEIGSTTAWCLWWRNSTGKASPTHRANEGEEGSMLGFGVGIPGPPLYMGDCPAHPPSLLGAARGASLPPKFGAPPYLFRVYP
jgi:hypothetical protein